MCFQPGYACRPYPQNKIDVRVYRPSIYTLYSRQCFPCLQDLARLKIALNILAHVPKRLLDPVLDNELSGTKKNQLQLYLL